MKKNPVFEIIGIIGLLALLVIGIAAFQVYRSPLAEPLSLTLAPGASSVQANTFGGGDTPVPAVSTAKANCGLSGTMTVLMIGRDEYFWTPPYGADAIRMIKVDFSQKTVKIFAFERDLKLSTPSLAKKYDTAVYKLGSAYVLVRDKEGNKAPGADIKATNEVAQILYDNFSIAPDHYVTLEEGVLANIVDTVGGISVNVPDAIAYPGLSLYLSAGTQIFDGRTAMLYSRYIKDGEPTLDEWGRIDRQALVFKGLASKLMQPAVLPKIPDLYKQVSKSLITDLSPAQIIALSCIAKDITPDSVTMKTVERDQMLIEANESMVIQDIDAIRQTLWDMFGKK